MPSTYTVNLGIEKPATGEQSGTWGDTVNDNSNILDEAINGVVSITLASAGSSGSPNQIAITNGASSTGRNKWIEFADGGDLGATAYVELIPNTSEKICFIRNSLAGSQSVILFQGTYNASNDIEIAAGTDVVVKFDGAGSGATVVNVNANLAVDAIVAGAVNIASDGATVTGIKDEDNMASDSATKLATQQSIKAYVDASSVSTFSAGSTGFTPSTGTAGAVTLAGTLALGSGGTGITAVGTSGNVLTSTGSAWASTAPAAAGVGYIAKSANYTTANLEGVLADTSSAAFTVTLPASPSLGDQVIIADAGGVFGTNNLTTGRNGSTIEGTAADLELDINGVSVQFVYSGTTWEVYAQVGGNGGSVVTLDGTQTLTNKNLSSATNTFPTSLATIASTQTLTNKTLTAPVLTAPVLGTPASGTMTNATGLPLTTGVTGTLPVANGGTGATTLTANNVLLGNGTSAPQAIAPSTSGNVLTSTGSTWASTAPAAGGSMVLLSTVTGSAASTIDVETTFDSTYDHYMIIGSATVNTDGAAIWIRYKLSGSYLASGYQYHTNVSKSGSTSYAGAQAVNDSYIVLQDSMGNAADESIEFTVNVTNPTSTTKRKLTYFDSACIDHNVGGKAKTGRGVGTNTATGALTGIRFYSNTTLSGTFRLYGIVKS